MNTKTGIPTGWHWARLGDVCEKPQYGYTAPSTQKATGVKYLRITDIQDSQVNWESVPYCEISKDDKVKYLLKQGDILFARTGATTGKSFLIQETPIAVFASYLIRVRPHPDSLLPEYLIAFLQSDQYWSQVESGKRGGAQPNMNATLLADVVLPLSPLPEQRRIAARLNEIMSEVARARAAAQAALDAANALPAALLRVVFESDDAKGWEKKRLGEMCEIVARQVDPKKPEYANLPHISGENIESVTCRLTYLNTAGQDQMTSGKYLFESGDVLYNKLRPYLRKVVVVDFGGVCSADMYPIRVNRHLLDPNFAAWMLLSESFTKYADEQSRRARMPKLNRDQLFAWDAPVIPVPDQKRIAAQIEREMKYVLQLRASTQAQLDAINALPAAYLRKAFRGEL